VNLRVALDGCLAPMHADLVDCSCLHGIEYCQMDFTLHNAHRLLRRLIKLRLLAVTADFVGCAPAAGAPPPTGPSPAPVLALRVGGRGEERGATTAGGPLAPLPPPQAPRLALGHLPRAGSSRGKGEALRGLGRRCHR